MFIFFTCTDLVIFCLQACTLGFIHITHIYIYIYMFKDPLHARVKTYTNSLLRTMCV